MWQKCPICNGEGSVEMFHGFKECKVCKGEMIISVLTGRPPVPEKKEVVEITPAPTISFAIIDCKSCKNKFDITASLMGFLCPVCGWDNGIILKNPLCSEDGKPITLNVEP